MPLYDGLIIVWYGCQRAKKRGQYGIVVSLRNQKTCYLHYATPHSWAGRNQVSRPFFFFFSRSGVESNIDYHLQWGICLRWGKMQWLGPGVSKQVISCLCRWSNQITVTSFQHLRAGCSVPLKFRIHSNFSVVRALGRAQTYWLIHLEYSVGRSWGTRTPVRGERYI